VYWDTWNAAEEGMSKKQKQSKSMGHATPDITAYIKSSRT